MKEILKAIMWSAILIGSIIGLFGLGLWCHSGSKIALAIAMILIWLFAATMIYCLRNYM